MTISFLFRFVKNYKKLSNEWKGFLNRTNIEFISFICLGHLSYSYATKEKREIIVKQKYLYTKNGFTEFMIVDELGRHYCINNCIWYLKWDSIEDWVKIKEEEKICIKYYGWRIPILGFFPNIVSVKNDICIFDKYMKNVLNKFENKKEIINMEEEKQD